MSLNESGYQMTSNRNNNPCRYILVLFIIFFIIEIASGDNSVRLFDASHQYITSSTLNWLPVNHYDNSKTIVVGGFQKSEDTNDPSEMGNTRRMFVCRASHMTAWVAGTQLEGEKLCTVTFLGSVKSYEHYDLLENLENAARLSWISWDKFQQISPGAVKTDTMYVARYVKKNPSKDGTSFSSKQYIGTLDSTTNLGAITYVEDDGKENSVTKGEILIETEPIYYELRSIRLNLSRKRIFHNEQRIIGEATISNSRNEPAKLAKAFGYSYEYLSYWGQGHGMIKALNTSIILGNGTRLYNIVWGTDDKMSKRSDAYTVEIYLQPETAVNVTLRANYTDYEVPYTGELVSHYYDNETRKRDVNGIRREVTIMDIKPEFGPIYFLNNGSIVPTTLAPPTTHETIGTTSGPPLKSTKFSSGSTNGITLVTTTPDITKHDSDNDDDDENMILPPRKHDMTNMQNDGSGPQSLKNKEDLNHSSSNTFQLSITLIFTLILINLYRIT